MKIPAICETCSTIFKSGFDIEASNMIMSGNKSGPCPKCGGMGHIPDGTFNFSEDTIELLRGPQRTVDELNILKDILTEVKIKSMSPLEARAAITGSKGLGELKKLADILPQNRSELYAFITLILLTIAFLRGNDMPQISNSEIKINIYNNVYIDTSK